MLEWSYRAAGSIHLLTHEEEEEEEEEEVEEEEEDWLNIITLQLL